MAPVSPKAPRPAPSLTVQGLSFSYPERHVFTHWSAHFGPGMTWLMGGNGSGKSTLLKLLAGAMPPSSGQIVLNELAQAAQPMAYRQQVFWCGPGAIPFEHLTPREYWGFMRGLYPSLDAAALQQYIVALGLSPHLDAPLHTLSTGTQRKVWVSTALAVDTLVTLIDEPFNALDAASLAHLRGALACVARRDDRICVLTSHEDLGPASPWARRLDLDARLAMG